MSKIAALFLDALEALWPEVMKMARRFRCGPTFTSLLLKLGASEAGAFVASVESGSANGNRQALQQSNGKKACI
ncbi:hypothetical protein NXC24_PC00471 (plasmid) [Rhizobium sp. NXC24]|nr:hypothetical protein NXC24_PC00471 [Rhizobium sp. NXC24]